MNGFLSDEWLHGVCAQPDRLWLRREGPLPLALEFRHRYGLRTLGMPPWTPVYRWEEFSKKQRSSRYAAFDAALRDLLRALPRRDAVQISFMVEAPESLLMACRWEGFRVFPRLVYQLDLAEVSDDPAALLNRNHRRDLRHARAQTNWQTRDLHQSEDFTRFARHYHALGTRLFVDEERYRRVVQFDGVRARGIFNAVGECLAGLVTLRDGDRVYAQINYQQRRPADRGALVRLYLEEMAYWRNAGVRIFNFNGSMLPGVEGFLRGFGGERTVRYYVRRRWFGF